MPSAMGEALAKADADRSAAAAKDATNEFSKAEKEPLASHKNGASRPGVTFAAQDKLPKLPIPELESSAKKYLAALEPLQTPREHAETEAAVHEFLRTDGPELQEKLRKYAEGKTSYIEQFWYDSYLNFDNPVVLNLNPFFLLEDDPTPARNNQVTRAASLVVSALSFVRAVRKEELPPDTMRGQPLDMYQYGRMFGTARIPTANGCMIAEDPSSSHIIVLCGGQFYWFDCLDSNSDLIMSEKDIAQNLQTIIDDSAQTPIQEAAKNAVGVLSTENRKIWSGLRDILSRDEGSNNAECLHIVDSALFVVALDHTEPKTTADLCKNMLCGESLVERGVQVGTCLNRLYDKLQLVVCRNGSAGINFEHTTLDGLTVLRFASDTFCDTILRFAKSINGQAPSLWTSMSPDPAKRDPDSFGNVSTTPHKLEWDLGPELSTAIRFAETRLADLIGQNEYATLEFPQYGKNFMTSMGFSPDAFVQMAFQAAYYGLYGRMECTYEPAATKIFLHGRTEAIRSVTPESSSFVKTFWGENPPRDKVNTLRKACERHSAITKECAKGQGQDRHLYALFCLWQRQMDQDLQSQASSVATSTSPNGRSSPMSSGGSIEEETSPSRRPNTTNHSMPAIFADAGWDKLNNTILSTSNCGNPSLRHFGFGPTSGDGFGIGYIIKDGSVSICASSKHRQTKRFVAAIESYFMEIRRVLRTVKRGESTGKGSSRAREAEESGKGRLKSRGRAIEAGDVKLEESTPSDDEGLGGYGFFDAGMLMQALKSSEEGLATGSAIAAAKRREVGKKLKLSEY